MTNSLLPSRENLVTPLRLLLAWLVLLSHSYGLSLGPDGYEPLTWLSGGALGIGSTAVNGFFIISGVLVFQSWQRTPNVKTFALKRLRRIYPGALVAIAASLALLFVPGVLSQPFDDWPATLAISTVLLHMPPIPGVFAANPDPYYLNGSLWTLHYELACYLLVPLFGVCRSRWPLRIAFGAAYAAMLVSPDGDVPRFAVFFLAGMLVVQEQPRITRRRTLAALLALVLAPVVTMPVAGTYLLLWLAGRGAWHGNHDYSYGVYLYAFPVQQLLVLYLAPSPLVLVVLSSLAVAPLAWLSWHAIEQPILKTARASHGPPQTTRPHSAPPLPPEAPAPH